MSESSSFDSRFFDSHDVSMTENYSAELVRALDQYEKAAKKGH